MHEARKLRTTNFSSFNEIKLIEKHTSMSFRVSSRFSLSNVYAKHAPVVTYIEKDFIKASKPSALFCLFLHGLFLQKNNV